MIKKDHVFNTNPNLCISFPPPQTEIFKEDTTVYSVLTKSKPQLSVLLLDANSK